MLSNKKISKLIVYNDSHEVFSNVDIKGGICYFLYDFNHNGDCQYELIDNNHIKKYNRNSKCYISYYNNFPKSFCSFFFIIL